MTNTLVNADDGTSDPGRETFVFDKNGILRMRYNNMNASQHTITALKKLKKLQDEK